MPKSNEKSLIAVTGATGNIGLVATAELLSKGFRVRAIGRSAAKLQALKTKGAEIFEGSLDDVDAMTEAFTATTGVFLMIPPNMTTPDFRGYQNKVGEALAKAAVKAKVRHIVNLSSMGAHLSAGTGPIIGLHDQEERLNSLQLAVEHLRPVFFMENHLFAIGVIKALGVYGNPVNGDVPMSQIATRDIGAFAAARLAQGPGEGNIVTELFGPRDISMIESARILGAAIGKPDLKFVQFPYDEARKGMIGAGMSANMADGMIELDRGFNEGTLRTTQKRSASNTGKTTLEQFAKTFKEIYEAQREPASIK